MYVCMYNVYCIIIVYILIYQGPVSRSPCALLKLDFLTNECICCMHQSDSPALVNCNHNFICVLFIKSIRFQFVMSCRF